MKRIILIIMLLVGIPFCSADTITLKLTTAKHNIYAGWFEIPNFILIYDYKNLSKEEFNEILVHEYTHYLCWKLFKVHPQDHQRCFTNKG
jgi:uncharacterized protein YjaZ